MSKVHHVTVKFTAGPLILETTVTVTNAASRDSVIAWAREAGYTASWMEDVIPDVFDASTAIAAIREEIAECKAQIGE